MRVKKMTIERLKVLLVNQIELLDSKATALQEHVGIDAATQVLEKRSILDGVLLACDGKTALLSLVE
jgi:hypothetical protein